MNKYVHHAISNAVHAFLRAVNVLYAREIGLMMIVVVQMENLKTDNH